MSKAEIKKASKILGGSADLFSNPKNVKFRSSQDE